MPRLRESLDELHTPAAASTKFQTDANKYQVRCGVCEEQFFVDEVTYSRVCSAIEFDATDNPFRCADCEEEYEEDATSL